jgi:hypothetical protein
MGDVYGRFEMKECAKESRYIVRPTLFGVPWECDLVATCDLRCVMPVSRVSGSADWEMIMSGMSEP